MSGLTIEERVDRARREGIPARLIRGAQILGQLARDGVMCARGWSRFCECGEARTPFCEVKRQWLELFLDYAVASPAAAESVVSVSGDEECLIPLLFSLRALTASRLTLIVEAEGLPPLWFPPGAFRDMYPTLFGGDGGFRPEAWRVASQIQGYMRASK